MRTRVQMLPEKVISSASNTYAKKSKRLGMSILPFGRLQSGQLHILEYLVERKYDKYNRRAVYVGGRERPLRLFEVLARNRQSALEQ